jgi:hypothetical protein
LATTTLLAVKPAFQGLDCILPCGLDFNYPPALLSAYIDPLTTGNLITTLLTRSPTVTGEWPLSFVVPEGANEAFGPMDK